MALGFSQDLIRAATEGGQYSHIYAVSQSGGSMSGSGVGLMSRGLAQLKKIAEKGEHVKGPVPKNLLRQGP